MGNKSVEESYKRLIELVNQGLRGQEIANEMGLSINTIRRYMVILRKEGRLPKSTRKKVQKRKYTQEETKKQNEQIIQQYNQGISMKKIAENLGLPEGTVGNRIKRLVSLGEIKKRPNIKQEAERRRTRIIELYWQDVSVEEMASIFGASESVIYRDINKLIALGKIEAKSKKIDPELEKKYRKILYWRSQGITTAEMAKKLKCSKATVFNYIKKLKELGMLPYGDREKVTEEELEQENIQIVKWYQQGLIAKEIADNLGLKVNTINCRIYELRQAGRIPPAKEENEERKKNRRIRKKLSDFLSAQQQSFTKGQTPNEEDIERIEKIVKVLGYRRQDVNLLVRVYAQKGMYIEAVKLLDEYVDSKKLPQKETEGIILTQNELRRQERIKRGLHKKKIPKSMIREEKNRGEQNIR